jgi:predicted RNA methylase
MPKEYLYEDALGFITSTHQPSPQQIIKILRAGGYPPEWAFDRFLPDELQMVSQQHWTPLVVAVRVAGWLTELRLRTVVDIGSGAGKFCVAAALAGTCRFIGLEQRPLLVRAARELAQVFEIEERVTFIEHLFGEQPTPEADVYYLYNPFGENLFGPDDHLDEDVELSRERYQRDVRSVIALLQNAPIGTYLLTYNGFGGIIPSGYREVRVDRELPNILRMWKKVYFQDLG